jgi:hypothetical protein
MRALMAELAHNLCSLSIDLRRQLCAIGLTETRTEYGYFVGTNSLKIRTRGQLLQPSLGDRWLPINNRSLQLHDVLTTDSLEG